MNIICANATLSKSLSLSIMTKAKSCQYKLFSDFYLCFINKTINFSPSKKTLDWKFERHFYIMCRTYVIARTPFYFLLHLKLIYSCQTPLKHSGINKLPFEEGKACSKNMEIIIKIIMGTNLKQNNHCKCVGIAGIKVYFQSRLYPNLLMQYLWNMMSTKRKSIAVSPISRLRSSSANMKCSHPRKFTVVFQCRFVFVKLFKLAEYEVNIMLVVLKDWSVPTFSFIWTYQNEIKSIS